MIIQLQDEVDTLRSQQETLKQQLAQRDVASSLSSPGESMDGMAVPTMVNIPDLNVLVEPDENMDKLDKDNKQN